MANRTYHSDELILDAAGRLLLERGVKATTIAAVAQASGAPKGSIYYRFASRDDIFARLWLRAVQRFQEALLEVPEQQDALEQVVLGALAVYDFCDERRYDARLLMSYRYQDLLRGSQSAALEDQLAQLNRRLGGAERRIAARLYGRATREARRRVATAVFDIPTGIAHRFVVANKPLPRAARADVERAVRAVLAAPLGAQDGRSAASRPRSQRA
jgi:AcrR family transcriptional regulator